MERVARRVGRRGVGKPEASGVKSCPRKGYIVGLRTGRKAVIHEGSRG